MPELPEVHALAANLDGGQRGRVVARLELLSFAALKTFDPPVASLDSHVIRAVTRHGKFLDVAIGDLHMVMHLARAGWIRWNDGTRPTPTRSGKSAASQEHQTSGEQLWGTSRERNHRRRTASPAR